MAEFILPGFKARPKARPISGKGRMFVPRDYLEWKASLRAILASRYAPVPTLAMVAIAIELHGPNKPRGDLDNLAGGILDAIQPPRARGDVRAQRQLEEAASLAERMGAAPGCLIGDDKQVIDLAIRWVRARKRTVVIRLEEVAT